MSETMMTHFLLNDLEVHSDLPVGTPLLDYLREDRNLTGAKPACQEGDCGSCTVLLGEWEGDALRYRTVNACLLPLGEAEGRHVVTVEGLNRQEPTPIQRELVAAGAIQCGYCTPGLVVALTGYFLGSATPRFEDAVEAVAGNLCRCTGYAGIRRAIFRLCELLADESGASERRRERLIELEMLPDYFRHIAARLGQLPGSSGDPPDGAVSVGGGTDLFVRDPDSMANRPLRFLSRQPSLKGVWVEENRCYIGAETPVESLRENETLQNLSPGAADDFRLICSTPVRHRATLAGNLANASPIADLAVYFLAHDAWLGLRKAHTLREVPLYAFFRGYKQIDLQPYEIIEWLSFEMPVKAAVFSFEKVCKRTHLDIAAVNSAMRLEIAGEVIDRAWLSAGGVAPVPLQLTAVAEFLKGRPIEAATVREAARVAQNAIAPIGDLRGSADYKRLLMRQLIYAHFLKLFPERISWEALQ